MSLARLLAKQFSKAVQDKGRAYFFSGAVKLDDVDDDFAAATVRGSETYEVELELHRKTLRAYCSCPYVAEHYQPCKHLWATILQLDAKDGLSAAQARSSLRLELEADDGYYDDGEDAYYDEPPWEPVAWPSRPSKRSRGRSASWKDEFAEIHRFAQATTHQREAWPAGRQVLYVIDVPGSLQAGGLSVEVLGRDRKKNGDWAKPKAIHLRNEQIATLPDSLDRRIVAALNGASPYNGYGYGYYGADRFTLVGPLLNEMLPIMGATGRLWLRPSLQTRNDLHELRWDDGPPWLLTLEVARADSGKQYVLTGSLRRGEERRPISSPLLLVPGAVVWEDHAARLDDQGAFAWVRLLRRNSTILVPLRDKDKLLEELLALPRPPRLELPEEMRFEEVSLPPRPRVVLKPSTATWRRDQLEGQLTFLYGDQAVPYHPQQSGLYVPEQRRLIRRDAAAEEAAEEHLRRAGFRKPSGYGRAGDNLELNPKLLSKVVRGLVEDGWLVEAEGSLYRKPGEFKLQLQSGIDWFDVEAAVDFEGKSVALPKLLEALRRGEDTVRLDDGTLGMLPEEWLKKYGFLARMGEAQDGKLRFRRTQVGLLDALLADQPAVALDEPFIRARDELRRFEGIAPAEPPASFVGKLRNYQREGLGWLRFLERFGFGGCLADDMGLGKTVQVLALLADRRATGGPDRPPPSLVVVPRSLIFNWMSEAARFTPQLKVLDHTGLGRAKAPEVFAEYDVVLTTYGTLRRDVVMLKDVAFDFAILDESQAIKNADSESAKAARLLRAHHRLALSGTPVENHLGELWSLFEFLNPGMLGQASVFQLGAGQRAPDADTRALLARALRPFILRRTKEQVAPELPAKTEQTLYCDLRSDQRKLYDELRDHYRQALLGRIETNGLARSKIQVLEALLRLRQAACHPGLIDKARQEESSAKLDALLPQLEEVMEEGHKALVFSQFTSLLAIVRARLDAAGVPYEYLDGRTRDRAGRVERFQNDPDCKLFLVSLKAGGVGLNLTAAEYVFLLDPWWNPAVEAQAIDRTHRIGQERPVFAYRLIARDTVEEKVLELQKTKRELADAIIGADNSLIRDLKREDLELLLS
jgi:superfamily II DNA or RNA helicase